METLESQKSNQMNRSGNVKSKSCSKAEKKIKNSMAPSINCSAKQHSGLSPKTKIQKFVRKPGT